jgi:hypothetical protein
VPQAGGGGLIYQLETWCMVLGLTLRLGRFMAVSKVLGEETIAGSAAQQQQQRGSEASGS